MNVPKLRFKEFNNEYNSATLKDITILIKDGTHGTHKDVGEGIPLLSAKDIFNNKINVSSDSRKISLNDFNSIYKNYSLKENDIMMTIVGSIGRTALYKDEKVAFQRSVATIRVNEKNNSQYIRNYLESNLVANQLKNMTSSSAQGGIYLGSLEKIKISLPIKDEQEKIANFLSLLDKKIELQSKKIEDLKLFKSYIEKNTFKKINNYKEYQLKDVLINGNKVPVGNTKEYKKITVKLNFNGIEFANLNRDMADTRPFYIREKGEIIIGKQNYFNGSIALISEEFDKTICSNAIMSFKVKEDFNNKYIFYYLSQPSYIKQRSFLANGTGQKELSEKEFMKFNIRIPDISQQDKLVDKFELIAKKINAENNKLGQLNELKKGLMQSMFV